MSQHKISFKRRTGEEAKRYCGFRLREKESSMIKRVHLVFKTHLDLGFTDLASAVVDEYMFRYIPQTISTCEELRKRGSHERMVWTTGAWLIHHYLNNADPKYRIRLEKAIEAGDITWHALPFTTHTELMDENLFEFGLSISKALDARFGRTTTAGKMTDVPGHTIAMVPLLAEQNIRFLHIGINAGSKLPEVPRLFRWVSPSGQEIMVQYDDDYGSSAPIRGMEDILCIVHSHDNSGPPSTDFVIRTYRRLRMRFPGAKIIPSTMDAYAAEIERFRFKLPVIDREIGDTWIHGIASDPLKVSRLKNLLRLVPKWAGEGSLDRTEPAYFKLMEPLLLSVEHTWGLDSKKYLPDYSNWSPEKFRIARERDFINRRLIPKQYAFIETFVQREFASLFPYSQGRRDHLSYSFFESSHAEKRAYLEKALNALPVALRKTAVAEDRALVPSAVPEENGTGIEAGKPLELGPWSVVFSNNGAIISLNGIGNRELVIHGESIGLYSYETYGCDQYRDWHRKYNRNFRSNKHWLLPDFGKPGMIDATPPPEHRLYHAELATLVLSNSSEGHMVRAVLRMGEEPPYGAPETVVISYLFHSDGMNLDITLDWFNKKATRMPEAMWLSFCPLAENKRRWMMVKLGMEIQPFYSVHGGASYVHAVEALCCDDGETETVIEPLDSPLVSLEGHHLLHMPDKKEKLSCTGRFHFVLYNNLWGTNFPLWYEDNGRSRFSIRWKQKKGETL